MLAQSSLIPLKFIRKIYNLLVVAIAGPKRMIHVTQESPSISKIAVTLWTAHGSRVRVDVLMSHEVWEQRRTSILHINDHVLYNTYGERSEKRSSKLFFPIVIQST